MQKKLIALAVAGLVSAPAFAQSNVTIYGVADAAIGIGEHGDNDFQGVVNGILSGSRIGLTLRGRPKARRSCGCKSPTPPASSKAMPQAPSPLTAGARPRARRSTKKAFTARATP